MLSNLKSKWRNDCAIPLYSFLITAFLFISLVLSTNVSAHFNLNVNLRIIHISHEGDGLRMFIRLPLAYLVADKLGPEKGDGTRDPAPFTRNTFENDQLQHYLDPEALRSDPIGLGKIIIDGHLIKVDNIILKGDFVKLRAYPALQQAPFATLKEAQAAVKGDIYHKEFDVTYVGDTVVDAEVFYPIKTKNTITHYELQSSLDPGLPLQNETANLILDHFGDDSLIFRIRGLLNTPVEISRSALQSFISFVIEGIDHILKGLDHVLFVICLVLSALTLRGLLWRVTGFTIGHSITLSAGFFGYTLKGDWFIPFVETAIAISIIYAAAIALSKEKRESGIVMTTIIGLLHGLGFSFVLSEILTIDAPNIWPSILAFNVGVEIGQLGIILVSWLLLFTLFPTRIIAIRWTIAVPCIAIASIWTGQRFLQLVSTFL